MKNINSNDDLVYFDFCCHCCDETFSVHLGYLKNKNQITCPNCSQSLPDEVLDLLKQATNNLENALIKLEKINTANAGWGLSLFWNNMNRLPKKKSRLSRCIIRDNEPYEPFRIAEKEPDV